MANMKFYSVDFYADELTKRGLLKKFDSNGQKNAMVTTLTYDSREAKQDTMFICKGAAFRAEYLLEAIQAGAVCYVSESEYDVPSQIACILVTDIRKAMAFLANLFYNRPWEDLTMVGIGGTDGKSTSVYYMKAVVDDYLASLGKRDSAIISTIDVYDGKTTVESHITTPEAIELQRHLRNAVDSGLEYAQMEVSSQALKYHRVDDMRFDVVIFLNISEDHISPIEHADFEDYFSSKMLMFCKAKTAVVNLDSDERQRILKEAQASENVLTFSTKDPKADFYGYNIHKVGRKTQFYVKCCAFEEKFVLDMPGFFNVENALGIIAAATQLGIPVQFIRSGLERAKSKGRMELYSTKDKERIAVVDYAHNKLSFEKLYGFIREEFPEYHIVSIFGAAGKKAFQRRRDLAMIAGRYAEKIYITAEDPGAEPAADISKYIAQYVAEQDCPYEMIEDRGEAIRTAIENAHGKTIFLITGKGRETSQKYGTSYIDCPSDVDYVQKYFKIYDEAHSIEPVGV